MVAFFCDGLGGFFELVGDLSRMAAVLAGRVARWRARFCQSIVPGSGVSEVGQRCSSRVPWLSWRCSSAMRGFRSSKAASMPMLFSGLARWAWPRSRVMPTLSK